ncbi:MAG: methionine gamma-lyase [Bacteroidetes bacterium OLB9]|nr:MAG: methionine gamma-lyase [Bacteroidetes bacterium OLB9]MCZ2337710.1 aminotransferase class I/II-fold pyridoxal phosphate-dependent enzyme [Chitinophagales bacterium]
MPIKISQESMCVKGDYQSAVSKPHQLPIYATSSFEFEQIEQSIDIFTGKSNGHVYSRYGNPTVDTVAQKIADLEAYGTGLDAWGFLTSSGMSAISVMMYALLKAGDAILTQGDLYGGTNELFVKIMSKQNINTVIVDLSDLDAVEYQFSTNRNIRILYIESPANPTMKCLDIHALSKLAKKYGIISCVDNTFCTPLIQQPLSLGADIVLHSTTKYLNGHGNSIAGAIVGYDEKLKVQIYTGLKLIGATCNSWDAWLIYNGLKTLALRMERHSDNAMKLAMFLESHPKVSKVNYSGLKTSVYHELAKKQMKYFGGMLSFEMDGTMEAVLKMINKLQFCTMAPTLGDVDTLVLHPATSSHLNISKALRQEMGITDGLVRVSVGLEKVEDIIEDFNHALK